MKPYDKVDVHYNGSVEGGRLKRDIIQNGLKVIFHPPVLYKLINDLYALFGLHYLPLLVTSYDDVHCL